MTNAFQSPFVLNIELENRTDQNITMVFLSNTDTLIDKENLQIFGTPDSKVLLSYMACNDCVLCFASSDGEISFRVKVDCFVYEENISARFERGTDKYMFQMTYNVIKNPDNIPIDCYTINLVILPKF